MRASSLAWLGWALACRAEPVSEGPPPPPDARAGADLLLEAGAPATFDGSGSTGAVAYAWSFGDGALRARDADPRATHAYAAAGRYNAVLEVWNEAGESSRDGVTVNVHWPLLPSPPRRSAALLGRDDGRLFAVMPDFGAVAVVDGDVVRHVEPCPRPRRLALSPDGATLAVACDEVDPAVVLLDATTLDERGRYTAPGISPVGVVFTDDGALIAAARQRQADAGLLLRLDADGVLQGDPVPTDPDVRGLAAVGDEVWISRFRSPDDVAGGAANGGQLLRWGADGAFTRTVLPHAPGPDSDTGARGIPNLLDAIAIAPDGRALAVGGARANVRRGLVRDGQTPTQESTVRAELRIVSLHGDDAGAEVERPRIDDRDLVSALAYDPTGTWLYAAMQGTEVVDVFGTATYEHAGAFFDVGHKPDGLWVSPDGRTLYVLASLSRAVVAIPVDGPLATGPARTIDLLPAGGEVLDADVLAGAVLFHRSADRRMTRDGYISCASCHPDGEHDGRTWDFTHRGEGLRNTTSLRGMALRAGGPIHWSANFDEVQDFEADIRKFQDGSGFLPDATWEGAAGPSLGDPKAGLSADLDALAAFVEQLGPPDVPWTRDPADEAAGRAAFVAAGCEACHPAGGTDSAWIEPGVPLLHDVGTISPVSGGRLGVPLTGFDTPDLRGVWASGPWLHDGYAPTLLDTLTTRRAAGRHGDVRVLDDAARAALERWLRAR